MKKNIEDEESSENVFKKLKALMEKKIEYEEGSENVFADLGIENSEECLAKSELARQIAKLIKKKNLTQKRAAEILGIDQPKISALIRGRLRSFSLERLIRFLNELGQDVSIMISPAQSNERGSTCIKNSVIHVSHIKRYLLMIEQSLSPL